MRWSTKKRLEFIESRLYWEGKVSRNDLTDFFDISIPQATKDFKAYSEVAPRNIIYDTRAKQYVAPPTFAPNLVEPSSERYLTRLQLLQKKENTHKFFNGTIPSSAEMPKLQRFVDTDTLQKLLNIIRSKEAVFLQYHSYSAEQPSKRWLTPHSLGNDGKRWHIRALCHKDRKYKDFVLGRILEIIDSQKNDLDHSIDFKWHNNVCVTITPNPRLSKGVRLVTERDYCMNNGRTQIDIKAAFIYYFYEEYGIADDMPSEKNPIVMTNKDEVDAQVGLLKRMTEEKINELSDSVFL